MDITPRETFIFSNTTRITYRHTEVHDFNTIGIPPELVVVARETPIMPVQLDRVYKKSGLCPTIGNTLVRGHVYHIKHVGKMYKSGGYMSHCRLKNDRGFSADAKRNHDDGLWYVTNISFGGGQIYLGAR